MYLQITTRCNMTCEHCCMNCTNKGDDMSIETVRNAIETFGADCITIGGGEPTIHPKFWEIFSIILGSGIGSDIPPLVVTNGSMTETSIALAALAKSGAIHAALSQDAYHDPIDGRVVQAFTKEKNRLGYDRYDDDNREIRDVTYSEINAGRCDFGTDEACPCNTFIVKPNGDVKFCGCDDAPIVGNVNEGFEPSEWYVEDGDHCVKESVISEEIYA